MGSNQIIPARGAALAKKKPIETLRDLLDRSKSQIATAIPKHMDADKMIRVAITALQKTVALQECDVMTVIGSVIEASQLGLYPDGILGDSYLVPYQGKCQLQIGYRGFINLARRSGQVSWICSELVYECDKFKVTFGTERNIIHEPDFENQDRGGFDANGELIGLRGAYAVVRFKDGTTDFEYLPLVQLNQIRNMSKAKNSRFSPWNTPEARPEMYRKIPIRRIAKRLPLSPEFQKAAVLDEYVDAGMHTQNEANVDSMSEVARIATENRMDEIKGRYLDTSETQENEQQNPPTPPEQTPENQPEVPAAIANRQPSTRRSARPSDTPQGVPLNFADTSAEDRSNE